MKQVSKVQNNTIQNTRIAQMYNTDIEQIHYKLNKCKKLIKEYQNVSSYKYYYKRYSYFT